MYWKVKNLWTSKEIGEYRAYVAAQASKRVGNQRCTCEDLVIRLVTDFAFGRGLPVSFANDTYKAGLTPEFYEFLFEYYEDILTSTGASDLLTYNTVKLVNGAVVGKPASLDLAQPGDVIIQGKHGSHVQVVTATGAGSVTIMQGGFRPESERAGFFNKLGGAKPSNPSDAFYIGANVAPREFKRDANSNTWRYEGRSPMPYEADPGYGRVMIWDFSQFNKLVFSHKVLPGESLITIAAKYYGTEWPRIYKSYHSDEVVRPGQLIYLWK